MLLINLLDHTFICRALTGVMTRTSEPGIHNVPSETQHFKLNRCQLHISLGKKLLRAAINVTFVHFAFS